jgi:hypothetical protein
VFPDEELRAARRKPFKIDLEALRREGVTVLTDSDLKKAR